MRELYVTFRSVTYAQRGQTVLQGAGMRNSLGRTPRHMEEKGCGYSLKIPFSQGLPALEVLKAKSVPFSKVYIRGEDGNWEELRL